MSEPYLGQLMLASWNYAPKGYAMCNGQLMAINSNQALFSLLGTTYGGNGIQNFALPDLRGRTPVSFGPGFVQGQVGGEEMHTLNISEVPSHTHQLYGTTNSAGTDAGAGNLLAVTSGNSKLYGSPASGVMNAGTITPFSGSQPHENRQPYLVMTWCIALVGIFPSRS
jgi:microcystin-dependent protein